MCHFTWNSHSQTVQYYILLVYHVHMACSLGNFKNELPTMDYLDTSVLQWVHVGLPAIWGLPAIFSISVDNNERIFLESSGWHWGSCDLNNRVHTMDYLDTSALQWLHVGLPAFGIQWMTNEALGNLKNELRKTAWCSKAVYIGSYLVQYN